MSADDDTGRPANLSRTVGIKQVAARAGVSPGTVSNVLNRPERVAAATRARVERAIRELGFVRNGSASTLRAGHSSTIGLMFGDRQAIAALAIAAALALVGLGIFFSSRFAELPPGSQNEHKSL